jgi:hypothetical protein
MDEGKDSMMSYGEGINSINPQSGEGVSNSALYGVLGDQNCQTCGSQQ